jgi:hypothetical protein
VYLLGNQTLHDYTSNKSTRLREALHTSDKTPFASTRDNCSDRLAVIRQNSRYFALPIANREDTFTKPKK